MKRIMLLAIIATVHLQSCTSSYITATWKLAESKPVVNKRIVVVAIVGDKDLSVREQMEKHLMGDLKELGYDAVCACEEYDPKKLEGLNEKEAIAKLREAGAEAIMTIVLLDQKSEKRWVPGKEYEQQVFWDYYTTINTRVRTEGYYTTNTKYYWESNLYDLTSNQLIYSVQSQSFDPESTSALAHGYGKMIVKSMIKKDVLVKQEKKPALKPM